MNLFVIILPYKTIGGVKMSFKMTAILIFWIVVGVIITSDLIYMLIRAKKENKKA